MSSMISTGLRGLVGVALVGGGCVLSPATAAVAAGGEHREIALLSGAADDAAPVLNLVMSGSGYPIPPAGFVDAVNELYLEPLGRGGPSVGVITPELYTDPTQSMLAGVDSLLLRIDAALADDPDTTFNVFGYSQSASLIALAMDALAERGMPQDQVHFVMAGNPSTPNGGLINMLDVPPFRELMLWVGQDEVGLKTPGDLYSADSYALEYDGFVDFPKYALNLVSTVNALLGLAFGHLAYLGLTPEQIASAVTLPIEGDSLVTYHMIPSELLPILAPLLLIPVIGQPLYDLLEPVTRIVANLGYGNMDHGWSDDPVNVGQVLDLTRLIPADIDMTELTAALSDAWDRGVAAFDEGMADLGSAVNGMANELLQPLVRFGQVLGALEPDDNAPTVLEFLTYNVIAQRENEEYFLEHYSSVDIPHIISYLFGSPYGFMLLTDMDFPEFDFSLS